MTPSEREDILVDKYGEVVTRTQAGRILNRSAATICNMLRDGRLDGACGGSMVDVRSIARYISAPEASEFEARKQRYKERHNTNWAV